MPLQPHPTGWVTDELLGTDYQSLTLPHDPGTYARLADPDTTDGPCTLVAYRPDGTPPQPTTPDQVAVLHIHGVSDYFFHTDYAEHLQAAGIAVFGGDLRRCGRSARIGDRLHYSRDFTEYFTDLNRMLTTLITTGFQRIVVEAHSTGGLIVPVWLDQLRQHAPHMHRYVSGLILNSPWLDLHISPRLRPTARLAISALAVIIPDRTLPQSSGAPYGHYVHRDYYGHWDYDLRLKPLAGVPKYYSWIGQVTAFQTRIRRGLEVGVPVLLLRSDRSLLGQAKADANALTSAVAPDDSTAPEVAARRSADVVLQVADMAARAPGLGSNVTDHPIVGASHDVLLSEDEPRQAAYAAIIHAASTWPDRTPTTG